MAYGVIRVDNASGTTLGKDLFSLMYKENGENANIENGRVVLVGDYISGEVREAGVPAANSPLAQIAIIASEEIVKTKSNNTLAEFINLAGTPARGYRPVSGDTFSFTAECLDGTPAKDDIVELQANTKLKVVKTATASATTVGKIVDVEGKYFVVEIN